MDARDAQAVVTEEEMIKVAWQILAGIKDDKYKCLCENDGEIGEFGRRHLAHWKMVGGWQG